MVLDDDPTGTQAVHDVPVLLDWEGDVLARTLAARPRSLHVLTNSRALDGAAARRLVHAAAAAAVAAGARRLLLRGDSTLRGAPGGGVPGGARHRPPGPLAPRCCWHRRSRPPGRVTVGGVHLIERDGVRVPLHETEYARDGVFAYRDARLLGLRGERSGGLLRAADGTRARARAAARARGRTRWPRRWPRWPPRGAPPPSRPTPRPWDDLALIAAGLRPGRGRRRPVVARSAPAFAGCARWHPGRGAGAAARAGAPAACWWCAAPTSRPPPRQLAALLARAIRRAPWWWTC